MRFAYADPPYPGQAHKYRNHPDFGGEVDHGELIDRLVVEYPDGWALSTSASALRDVLELCPPGVRIASWHVSNSEPPGNRKSHWWWSWEPLVVAGGRTSGKVVRDVLTCGNCAGFAGGVITGQKPVRFIYWMFALLGAQPGDELADLFPGSGAVGQQWDRYQRQGQLA